MILSVTCCNNIILIDELHSPYHGLLSVEAMARGCIVLTRVLDYFYEDMKRWAFHSQCYFLVNKAMAIQNHLNVFNDIGLVDRSIFEDKIFARNLYELGGMLLDEWNLYKDLYVTVIYIL